MLLAGLSTSVLDFLLYLHYPPFAGLPLKGRETPKVGSLTCDVKPNSKIDTKHHQYEFIQRPGNEEVGVCTYGSTSQPIGGEEIRKRTKERKTCGLLKRRNILVFSWDRWSFPRTQAPPVVLPVMVASRII